MSEIAKYNDLVRQALINPAARRQLEKEGCQFQVILTAAFKYEYKNLSPLLKAIAEFDQFSENNNPYGEHDFISLTHNGNRIIAKFDYYAPDLEHGSECPEDLSQTVRVMTIMLREDY